MPVFTKGSFNINLGIVSIGGEIDEADRQCAWELYCEIITRVGVIGKFDQDGKQTMTGEVLAESLDSLHRFFQEARGLMRRYPVGSLGAGTSSEHHLGFFIAGLLETVIRPFLEKWQARYRYWWQHQSDHTLPPFRRQAAFPGLAEMQSDWFAVRHFCNDSAAELAARFGFPEVTRLIPPRLQQEWLEETERVLADL
jgi:hypothetical protein